MKLQKNTVLALYSVLEFAARPDEHVPSAQIAEKYGESVHHLAKVLSVLARAGIVESVRGVGGGYRFAANPRRLTLLNVVVLFEDLTQELPEPPPAAGATHAELSRVLGEIDQIALATLSSITIATMLKAIHAAGAPRAPAPETPAANPSTPRARRAPRPAG